MHQNLVRLCRRYGIAYPVKTLIDGTSSTCYNYGIIGAKMRHNLKCQWLKNVTEAHGHVYLVESSNGINGTQNNDTNDLKSHQGKGMLAHYLPVLKQRRTIFPFGLAQINSSAIRGGHELNPSHNGHFIYSSPEQMEMTLLFFAEPSEASQWVSFWRTKRLQWWNKFARKAASFNAVSHSGLPGKNEEEIQYSFPWGETSVESICDHGPDPVGELEETLGTSLHGLGGGKLVLPHVIELTTSVERTLSAFIFDSYVGELEDESSEAKIHFHPKIAPYHVALVTRGGDQSPELKEISAYLAKNMHQHGIFLLDVYHEDSGSVPDEQRYDDIGILWTVTLTEETLEKGSVLLRSRETGVKEIASLAGLGERLSKYITAS